MSQNQRFTLDIRCMSPSVTLKLQLSMEGFAQIEQYIDKDNQRHYAISYKNTEREEYNFLCVLPQVEYERLVSLISMFEVIKDNDIQHILVAPGRVVVDGSSDA